MKPDMYLITHDFPYRHTEDSFVKPEYAYLRDKFHVTVITAEVGKPEETVCDNSMESCIIPTTQSLPEKLISFLRFLCEKDYYMEMVAIIKDGQQVLKRMYKALMFGTVAETFIAG